MISDIILVFILGRRKCRTVMSSGCTIFLHSSMFICNARAFSRSVSLVPLKKSTSTTDKSERQAKLDENVLVEKT